MNASAGVNLLTPAGGVPECAEAERVFIAPVVGWLVVSRVVHYLLVGGIESGTLPTCWRSREWYTTYLLAVSRHDRPNCAALAARARGATPQFFRISKKSRLLSPHMGHGSLAAEAKGKNRFFQVLKLATESFWNINPL